MWLTLSVQSFGGGMATLALIRRAAVEQEQWLTEAEFARYWSLVQLAPGINLIALIILIGRKVAGWRGVCLTLFGLLLPSAAITVGLTAGYVGVQQSKVVRDALSGIIPAVVGMGLLTAWQIARPVMARSRREGKRSFLLSLALLVGSGLAAWRLHPPVVLILLIAGTIYAVWQGTRARE